MNCLTKFNIQIPTNNSSIFFIADIVRILLRNNANVDARAREDQTPLHVASRLGNSDIVMLLLQHGASVDTTTKDLYTPLHIAAKEGQDEVSATLGTYIH